MSVIFDGTFPVAYYQAYVLAPEEVNSDFEAAFVGQQNGLLGASVPGQLWLTTGLHSGHVALRIEVVEGEPSLDDAWQDVVEVSFEPTSPMTALTGWAGQGNPISLGLDIAPYRVRLCAAGMDEAKQQDTLLEGEPPIDRYLLVFWTAESEQDRVIKQTSRVAASWNEWAQSLRPT